MKLKTNPSGLHYQGVYDGKTGDKTAIGTYHLADHPDLYEPQRSNNFEFLVNLNGIDKVGYKDGKSHKVSQGKEMIRVSVSEAAVPHFTQGTIRIRRGNSEIKFADVPSFGSGSIAINDYIGCEAYDALMGWQNLSYDVQTEKVGLAADYKKTATLVCYSPDYQVVRRWKLYGCWISGISEPSFSSENSGKRTISATIEYDHGEVDNDI